MLPQAVAVRAHRAAVEDAHAVRHRGLMAHWRAPWRASAPAHSAARRRSRSPRFCRRDTLVGRFWPELDSEHARGALRKATYFLRQHSGEDLFARRGTEEVGLADGVVEVDVALFEAAARAGLAEAALELYRGDFLNGFFVSGAPEVERWIETEQPVEPAAQP